MYFHYHCDLYNKRNPFAAKLLFFGISGLCQLNPCLGLPSELHQLYQLCRQGGTGAGPAGTVSREGGPGGTLSAGLSGSLFQAYLYWTLDQKAFRLACKKQLKCIQKSHPVKQMHGVCTSWLTTLTLLMCGYICIRIGTIYLLVWEASLSSVNGKQEGF